jgi:hypothetical protein
VQDAPRVRGLQRARKALTVAQDLGERQGLAEVEQAAQAAALDQLHRDPGHAVVLEHLEDGDDVGVAELGGGARLALEALALDDVRRVGALQGDDASELQVARAVEDAHAAAAELPQHLVVADDRAGWRGRDVGIPPVGHTQSLVWGRETRR